MRKAEAGRAARAHAPGAVANGRRWLRRHAERRARMCARAGRGGIAMSGRNKKQRAGSAAHAAAATARARAAQAGIAAAADVASRTAPPRPAPASKEPRVKQGSVACRAPGAAVPCRRGTSCARG